jgi:hypothetical protein
MDINTGAQHAAPRFNEKGCLQVWGGDTLTLEISFPRKF